MINQRFSSMHLYSELERLTRFRNARDLITSSKGQSTIDLELHQPSDEIGEINFGPARLSQWSPTQRKDSDYFILVGMESYRLKYGNNRIGRYDDNDVVIDEIYVSRRHCCIVVHSNGSAELFDTASKNRTFVNGVHVESCLLKSGDEVRLAGTIPLIISISGN